MKRFELLLLTGLLILTMGFTNKQYPAEGVYNLKLKTLTMYDIVDSKDIPLQGIIAELTESKPAGLKVDVDLAKLVEPTYGSLKLGNNNRKTWFLMGKDEQGYYTNIYLDQNDDQLISPKEAIKSMQTFQTKVKKLSRETAYTMIPVPIRVSYKGVNAELQKKLYFFFYAEIFRNKTEALTVVNVYNCSFLEGDLKVVMGKETNLVKFRIFDIDSNGCYNDFDEDMIYMDTNFDGFFKKKEGQKLAEYFDSGKGQNQKHFRLVLMPQPSKLAIIDAVKDADKTKMEAVSDPADDQTGEKDAKEIPKPNPKK